MHVIAKILVLGVPLAVAAYFYFKNRTGIYFVLAAFLFGGWFLQIQPVDDMFIPLRYARNWAAGYGPVFNIGERVEGYTCFLWVAILTGLRRLSFDPLIVARSLSVIVALDSVLLLHLYSRQIASSDFSRTAAVTLLAFNLPFLYWAFVGMEATLGAFLNLLIALSFLRWIDSRKDLVLIAAFVLCALSAMTRPEAVVVFGVSWISCVILSEKKWRDPIIAGLAFSLLFGSFLLWRHSYYGYFLPNTYYAKVDHFGLSLLMRGARYSLLFGLPNFLLFVPLIFVFAKPQKTTVYISTLALVYCLSVALEGGDHYAASRLFVPVIPLLALLWCHAGGMSIKVSPVMAAPLMVLITFWGGFFFRGYEAFETAAGGPRARSIAYWLTAHVPPNTLIATMSVGVVPYYSNLPTLDLLGLVDSRISHSGVPQKRGKSGHEKFDNDYVMKRRPGVFLFAKCYADEATLMKEAKGIVPMYDDLLSRFFPNPDYVFVRVRREGKYCSSLLVRKDLATHWELDKAHMFVRATGNPKP